MNTRVFGALVAPLFLLSSCAKLLDYAKDHPADVASCCRIDSVTTTSLVSPTPQHYNFLYNTAGLPVEIAAQVPGTFNYQNYYFRYDSHNRLKDYLFTDGGGATYVYSWDRYTYPAHNIVVDSTYDYQGMLSDPNPIYPDNLTSVKTITQDAQGRNTRIIYWSPYYQDTTYIHYDAQGDVILPGVGYDNKVNWYQLSPTWQLVFNDYSKHNPYAPATLVFPASITAYDQYGLPTAFKQRATNATLMVFNSYATIDVSYSCDTAKAIKEVGY